MKRKIILLVVAVACLVFKVSAQKANDIQVKYVLNQLAQRMSDKHAETIIPMLSTEFQITHHDPLTSKSVLRQIINQIPKSTVSFSEIKRSDQHVYAQGSIISGTNKQQFMVKLNEFLEFDRIGFFEQALGFKDPVAYEFTAAKIVASMPLERAANMIFVNLKLAGNSKPLRFLIDSGAGVTALDSATVANYNIEKSSKKTSVRLSSGMYSDLYIVTNPVFQLADFNFNASYAVVSDLSTFSKSFGLKIDGIIGYDLLRDHLVELDLDKNLLNVYDGADIKLVANTSKLPIKLSNNTPKVPLQVSLSSKTINESFMFDTGADLSIVFNTYADMLHRIQTALSKPMVSTSNDVTGGANKTILGYINWASFGKDKVNQPVVAVSLQAPGADLNTADMGFIGMGLLGKYNMIFNYPKGYIGVSPNQSFSTPSSKTYLYGIGAQQSNGNLVVSHVNAAGLAAKAGLKSGDQILSVMGKKVETLSQFIGYLKQLQNTGGTVDVQRNGNKLTISLAKIG